MIKKSFILPAISMLVFLQCSLAQVLTDSVRNHVRSIVKSHFGAYYESCIIFDVDAALSYWTEPRSFDQGPILEDSAGQLRHCQIVIYTKSLPGDTSGYDLEERNSIAILRNDSVIWHSAPLLYNCCGAGGMIDGFCDVNNDGVTDIIVSDATGASSGIEDLWIISPDSKDGRLLNTINYLHRSNINGAFDSFRFSSRDRFGRRTITAFDPSSEKPTNILYRWNGRHFVRSRR